MWGVVTDRKHTQGSAILSWRCCYIRNDKRFQEGIKCLVRLVC
jgi:hypothetical protein